MADLKRIIVDSDLCTGCRLCQIACSFRHYSVYNLTMSRIHVKNDEIGGRSLPVMCCQCEAKPCVSACPTGALDAGRLSLDKELCAGCMECVKACPNGAIFYHESRQELMKCDMCSEKPGESGDPACVRVCPTNALKMVNCNLSAIYDVRRYQERVRGWLSKGGDAE